jgi:hypothetical protein
MSRPYKERRITRKNIVWGWPFSPESPFIPMRGSASRARHARGWSTYILARKAGASPSLIEKIDVGKYDPEDEWMVGIAANLAKVLEIAPPLP